MATLVGLWERTGLPAAALDQISLTGSDPILPSSFLVGTAAQASIAACGLAAAQLWQQRGGELQRVSVDMRHALAEFRSERYLRVNGGAAPELWDALAGLYRCADDQWVRLHTNFPHHRNGVVRLLECGNDRASVAQALRHWQAQEFEQAAADAGLVVAAARSFAEWDAHPQGIATAAQPLFTLTRIGDGPVLEMPAAARPLSGVRVLELARIIAAPVAGRTLAAHGADVMLVSAPHLPSVEPLVMDTGRGKQSCHIDLRQPTGQADLQRLLADADVFLQAYRPGGLADLGWGATDLAARKPGIVVASLSAYGTSGPWAARRGFDSLVQTASGLNLAEAAAFGTAEPRALPAQVLDHASGYLLALGIMAALYRRAHEGGSWQVDVSLAQTGHWLRTLGRNARLDLPDTSFDEIGDLLDERPSGFGLLTTVTHAARLARTPARWTRPSVPLGTHAPAWGGE